MDIIQWTNKEGYTLNLTRDEIEELYRLLKNCVPNYFITQKSEHFIIELDDYKEERL